MKRILLFLTLLSVATSALPMQETVNALKITAGAAALGYSIYGAGKYSSLREFSDSVKYVLKNCIPKEPASWTDGDLTIKENYDSSHSIMQGCGTIIRIGGNAQRCNIDGRIISMVNGVITVDGQVINLSNEQTLTPREERIKNKIARSAAAHPAVIGTSGALGTVLLFYGIKGFINTFRK